MHRAVFLTVIFSVLHVVFAGNSIPVGPPITAGDVPATAMTTSFDLVVYGNEPEAILAAVTGAEEGLATLLIAQHDSLGGLYTQGWLNVLDLKTQPHDYQLGIFDRWWRKVGREDAFDIPRGEAAFADMLETANVHVMLGIEQPVPVMENNRITGVYLPEADVLYRTRFVIDGSADADLAAASGAPFTVGWESFGVDMRMADTLVFRLGGVDWHQLTNHIRGRGSTYAVAKNTVAWGHFGNIPAQYVPSNSDSFKLRGLNLGLQSDGSVLVNALLIYGIDPLDPQSLRDGRLRAIQEADLVTAYLGEHIPGLENAYVSATAPELYVRESRHLQGLCTLDTFAVMHNHTGPHAIAAGGYPLDAQSFTPADSGYVWATPGMFGGELCMMTPPEQENLFVAGRSGSFDPVTFASGRIVPFGVVMAEGAAVAAAHAIRSNLTAQAVATMDEHIETVRERLRFRGAYIPDVYTDFSPLGPHTHNHFDSYVLMVSRGLALGGYDNNPQLNQRVSSISLTYLLANVATRFFHDHPAGVEMVRIFHEEIGVDNAAPLTEATAQQLVHHMLCVVAECEDSLVFPAVGNTEHLTRGESYAYAALVVERAITEIESVRR